MELASPLIGRKADLNYLTGCAGEGKCCSLVAVSNLGKTALLRHLCASPAASHTGTWVYVDCNQMAERTARAFFTSVWRAIAAALKTRSLPPEVLARVEHVSEHMADAPGAMSVMLHFEQGLALALEQLPNPIVLCLDEFDEAYQNLEQQTFLNLRSLRDRYGPLLIYITATERELARMTVTREQGEFYELIVPHVRFLHFWESDESRAYALDFAEREHVTFDDTDLAFIWDQADGHPGLVQAVCYSLGNVTGAPVRDAHQDRVIHQLVQENLWRDANVQSECAKIWNDLEEDERAAILDMPHADPAALSGTPSPALAGLLNKSIVRSGPDGAALFCRSFDRYVRRQQVVQQPNARGVYIDVDAGNVWVEGKPIGSLTELEYRLLLFLYGRLGRLCDKYAIVEAVWGQDYVDQVDDARIEKLISRLRQKIEPDAAHPRYLQSLRGRGYKLVR